MAQTFQIVISATDKATATVRKVNDAVSKLTRPFDQVGKSFKSLGREIGFDKIGANLSRIGADARAAARGIASIAAPLTGITGIASVAGVIALADGVAKLGRNVTYSAQDIGIGTTQLQEFQGAARLAGLSGEAMTQSLTSLGDTMEDALYGRNQQALMLFNRLGIGIKRTASGAVDAAGEFDALGRAIYNLFDPQKQRLVAGQFGLTAMLPLIRKYHGDMRAARAEAEKTGLIMTPAQIKSADEFADKLAKMDITVSALKNSIGNALMPAIEPLLNGLTDWVGKNRELIAQKIGEYAREFGAWLRSIDWKRVGKNLRNSIDGVDHLVHSINDAVKSIGGWNVVMIGAGAIMGAKFLSPVLSIAGAFAKISVASVSAITGLSGMAAVFGTLATAIAAATGALAGYWIYTHFLQGTKAGDVIAEGAARLAATLGIPGAQEALDDMHRRTPENHSGDFHPERTGYGKAKVSKAMQYFMSQGWTRAQSAGIVGNLEQESGLNPNAVNAKSGAMGVGQWLGSRVQLFQQVMHEPLKGASFEDQLKFINWELNNSEKQAGGNLRRTTAVDNAALVFGVQYERFGDDGSFNRRTSYANEAFNAAPNGPYSQPVAGKNEPQKVHVTVSAEPGTKARVKPDPNVTASTRVATSMVGAAA